jgi:undecaprenyl phosphate-alpha-L-ara4FN deformylase
MKIGLRIDVGTFRGTKLGVPNLCRVLAKHSIKGSFFFTVGPDNMGRHLWRLLKPAFLWKMLRTKAAGLYGWDIIFKGTFWPGPIIGPKLAPVIRATSDAGHEIGLHAWDHHAWQAHVESMSRDDISGELKKGFDALTVITGKLPSCSAVPGWKCTKEVFAVKETFPFEYNSDCRGESIFYPVVDGKPLSQPQIPVTLPTYDEVIGHSGIADENYNEYLLSLVKPGKLNVLTIHAEAEGFACLDLFKQFLTIARKKGISFVPLGNLLYDSETVKQNAVICREISGREGWVCCQSSIFSQQFYNSDTGEVVKNKPHAGFCENCHSLIDKRVNT